MTRSRIEAALALLCWPALWLVYRQEDWWRAVLAPLAGPDQPVLYERIQLIDAAQSHVLIVLTAMAFVVVLGVPLAILATRTAGKPLLPLIANTATIGQTLPPIAVLFLVTPVVGFGPQAMMFALFTYGLMPTVQATLTGWREIDADVRRAAEGMGMGPWRQLLTVELPLALPGMLAGIRTSLILSIATASLAPITGGVSLGTPIVSGLAVDNASQVMEGALAVALLALCSDYSMRVLQRRLTPWRA